MVGSVEKMERQSYSKSHTVRDRGSQYCRSIHRDFEVNRLSSDMVHGRALWHLLIYIADPI